MIIFDPSKSKKISFDVSIEGLDPNNFEFWMRLNILSVEYGFKCDYINGMVTVEIPALKNIVKNIQVNTAVPYKIKMEAFGADKFYIKPFEDNFEFKIEPRVEAVVKEAKDELSDITIKSVIKEETDSIQVKSTESNKTSEEPVIQQHKNTRFRAVLKS